MKSILFAACFVLSLFNGLNADEGPVCRKCQIIREENKHKVNPYPYYDDYLKEHPEAVEMNAVPHTDVPPTTTPKPNK